MKVTEPEDTLPYTALYRATIEEAVGGAKALMTRLVAHVRSALREAESQAHDRRERDNLTSSRRLLNQYETSLALRFADELQNAFTRQSSFDRVVPSPAGLQFDRVGGMDDRQLAESVDAARVKHAVQQAADSALTDLNALICTMLGLKEVQLERNPLRPGVYVEAVTAALSHLPVPAGTRQAWIMMMSRALGQELDIYYRSLCDDLRDRGVGLTGGATALHEPHRTGSGPVSGQGGGAAEPVMVTLEKLRRLLADAPRPVDPPGAVRFDPEPGQRPGESGFSSSLDVPTGFRATVPAALDALRDMQQVDEVVRRLQAQRDPGQKPLRANQLRDELRRAANGLDQALGLEVVAMMVDNIAHDPRLLGPVQDLVAALEPALLQLALVDPRFFSHRQHPARRLLHEITHRSIAFESLESRGFSSFMVPLREAVAPLAHGSIATAEPFDQALQRLSSLLDDPAGRDQRQLARAVAALQMAEQRNVLATTIVAEVQSRGDAQNLPAVAREFLCGPWAQVVAQARIHDTTGAMDPGQYAQAIDDVVWALQPASAAGNPKRLRQAVGSLKPRLLQGIASIDYPVCQAQAMFDLLDSLVAMRAAPTHALQSPGAAHAGGPELPAQGRDSLWLAPTEAQMSGFVDLSTVVPGLQPVAASDALEVGAWVALWSDGGWTRTRLGWASPNATLLLFSDALGFMQSYSRRACEQLFAAGRLRIISADPVGDALDAVAQTALDNSVDIRL